MPKCVKVSAIISALVTAVLLLRAGIAPAESSITDVDIKNSLQINIPAPEIIPGLSNPPLRGISLNFGENIRLDRPYASSEQAPEGCIYKPDIRARFCIDPVRWPESLLGPSVSDDVIYRGNQAIVRYDNDRASQAHILFPANRFIQVLEHIESRFGQPTEQNLVKTYIPDGPPIINTVVRWKSVFDGENKDLILEVRAHDDTRRTFPDQTHGFMWLYRTGDQPIFHQISVIDLMVLRKRRIGGWPFDDKSGKNSKIH